MAYRDEIDHSRDDAAGGQASQSRPGGQGARNRVSDPPRRRVWGGIAAAVGLLLLLIVALSLVGEDAPQDAGSAITPAMPDATETPGGTPAE